MPESDSIAELVGRWLAAWNSHQAEQVLALLTDDVEVRDDSWPVTMHGHAEVRSFLQALWHAMPDMTFELVSGPYVIAGEPRASFHWRGYGTFSGRMDPPGFAPTGRRWEVDGADFHEYRDGRIVRLRVVLDVMSVTRQVGLMPPAGSRAERVMAAAQRGMMRARQVSRR